MSQIITIEKDDLIKIIESDWDDNMIRLKVGEFILSKAEKQFKDISKLLNMKFVKDMEGINLSLPSSTEGGTRCCRGR